MNWHRMFGILLTDFFTGSPFVVEVEKDLPMRKQLLDVIILRKGKGRFTGRLPDGLDNLAAHNLLTFKSHREALDDWALKELTGHYVNYRKQTSGPGEMLLPESEFRLYAVSSRFPQGLAGVVDWQQVQAGVYECRRGTDVIRVIVLGELPAERHNAVLHLLSVRPELVAFAARNYEQHSPDTSTVVHRLFEGFEREGMAMPYTMDDFRREFIQEHFTPEQRVEGLTAEERLRGLPPEERLRGLSPEEIEKHLRQRKEHTAGPKRRRKK